MYESLKSVVIICITKELKMTKYCFVLLVIMFLSSFIPVTCSAKTFCVSDATELQNALITATSNGEDDIIQIEQGTYVGSLIYVSLEAYNLTIEGRYLSECISREVDSGNTVIDGNKAGSVLVFSSPST